MNERTAVARRYVMFQNNGVVDPYALQFIGFTDKASDPNAIGMFGSGFKLAATAAMRQGIDVVLYAGLEKMTLKGVPRRINDQDVVQLVFVRESPDGKVEEDPTSWTLGYGSKDWKKAWSVFREMLANCRDEDPHGYEVVLGVDPRGREGSTRVFVEATEEILDIYRNLDHYFKEERNATFSCDDGRVYPKSAPDGSTNFYCKGMFVLSTRDFSLFDYDLFHMPINESRDASTENLMDHVLQLLDLCPPDIKTDVVRYAVEKSQEGVRLLESSLYWTQSRRPHAWVEAFRRAFPDHVLCSFSDVEFQNIRRLGRKAVRVTRELYRLLSAHGVKTAEQVLRDEQEEQREMFEPDGSLKEYFDQAFARVGQRLPEVNRLQIGFIRLPPSERHVSFITCNRARGEYHFTESLLKSGPQAVTLALIDALAQTKSHSGKCDLDYEAKLIELVAEAVAA